MPWLGRLAGVAGGGGVVVGGGRVGLGCWFGVEEVWVVAHPDSAVVTGAFSFTGRYVARRLLDEGVGVRTLCRDPGSGGGFGGLVPAARLDFSDPEGLCAWMKGAGVLYNTYWIRFERGQATFDGAVDNTAVLFEAAVEAGVGRIVYFSVSGASVESRHPYVRAKARVEEMLKALGVPYAIVRPTLIFGEGDLLINNMAWALRRFPLYPVFGDGGYEVQPVYAGDVAEQAVRAGAQHGDSTADAAGPETFTYEALLRLVGSAVGARVRLWPVPPPVGLALTRAVGLMVRDVVLTRDEVAELMGGQFTSAVPPTGETRLSDWLRDNHEGLGREYLSELRRNFGD